MTFFQWLVNHTAPALPDPSVARWALHAAWGLLLAALTWRVGRRLHPGVRGMGAGMLLLWALWPGSQSVAFGLGLAFQSPSVMAVLLALAWVLPARSMQDYAAFTAGHSRTSNWPTTLLTFAGVLLGWVLLGDMLAWWPVSVYAWGFSPAALMAVAAVLALWWMLGGYRAHRLAWVLALALGFFVSLRLPSGNVWDAMLDPWLWLVLHAVLLRRLMPKRRV
ncbi:hypothetical protein [Rhodoferax sp.]|uniref:hypothetical protein n=1 Tax=Rhodoferax sp. TaxID=50421 RepID=UPI0026317638|nr:hypothetical protein [Rhodoferax sp.]